MKLTVNQHREYLSVHFWKVVSVNNSGDVYAHTQERTHMRGRGRKQSVCAYSPGWCEVCKIRWLENCQEGPIPETQVIHCYHH